MAAKNGFTRTIPNVIKFARISDFVDMESNIKAQEKASIDGFLFENSVGIFLPNTQYAYGQGTHYIKDDSITGPLPILPGDEAYKVSTMAKIPFVHPQNGEINDIMMAYRPKDNMLWLISYKQD